MRKLIAAMNMTLDGYSDHAAMIAGEEIQHYSELLRSTGTVLYGRMPYQLMEYWPSGLPLFKNTRDKIDLTLLKTKTFGCGAVTHCYELTKKRVQS